MSFRWRMTAGLLAAVMVLALAGQASAISAWGRKYGGDCGMCHFRINALNQAGKDFLYRGHRMENESEAEGGVNHYFSATEKIRYRAMGKVGGVAPSVSTDFVVEALSLYSGGALDEKVSYFYEFYLFDYGKDLGSPSAGAPKLADAYVTYNYWFGEGNYFGARFGHMIPLLIHTHGGGARMSISRPTVIAGDLTPGANKFNPRDRTNGIEFSTKVKPAHLAVAFVNGDYNGQGDGNNSKDVWATAEVNAGPGNLGGYFYKGKFRESTYTDDFKRFGFLGDVTLVDKLMLHGAFLMGTSTNPASVDSNDIKNRGLYAEADFLLTEKLAPYFRLDLTDPDTDVDNNQTTGLVGGVSCNFSKYARGTLELVNSKTGESDAINTLTAEVHWMY